MQKRFLDNGRQTTTVSGLSAPCALNEMHTSQTVIRYEPPWSLIIPDAHFLNYGLGWFLHDFRGRKVVQHGGNMDGMSALVAMIPDEKLGLVILTNMNGTLLTSALAYKIFDLYTGTPERDWSAELLKTIKGFEEQGKAAQKKQEESRVKGTQPPLPLDKYTGAYKDEMYGEAKVTQETVDSCFALLPLWGIWNIGTTIRFG